MANIGIIGWGIVGQATGKAFATNKDNQVLWWDKYKKSPVTLRKLVSESDVIFVCVPTPMKPGGKGIDLSIINEATREINKNKPRPSTIVCIKSTVIPGTTVALAKKYPSLELAMSPEFVNEITAEWDFLHPDRVVIGAIDESVAVRLAILHKGILDNGVKIFITDPTTAELVKYASNTFLATKIMFANEMKELSDVLGVNYDDVKKMVGADKRIGEANFGVTPFRGFGGKCHPKDMAALLSFARKKGVDLTIINAAWEKNLKVRKIRDWENIEGAVSTKKHKKRT